jgi:hypothetical protein
VTTIPLEAERAPASTRLAFVPVLTRDQREKELLRLAEDVIEGTPPSPHAVAVLIAAWAADGLTRAAAADHWDVFLAESRIWKACVAGEPEWRDMSPDPFRAAAMAALDNLLDGTETHARPVLP